MAPQIPARCITHAQLADEFRIAYPTLLKIVQRHAVALELGPVEGLCLVEYLPLSRGLQFLFQMCDCSRERETKVQFGKTDEIAATSAPMAVEEVLVNVDVELGTAL